MSFRIIEKRIGVEMRREEVRDIITTITLTEFYVKQDGLKLNLKATRKLGVMRSWGGWWHSYEVQEIP